MFSPNKGQAVLEYVILSAIVAVAVISTNFLWFNWVGGQAEANGPARDIAQQYFSGMVTQILGNNT